ncbi:MAG: hypothetical protein PWP65_618 [Clostridia bacterium]|nr:hypothetical protein [Clostridia bacterium]
MRVQDLFSLHGKVAVVTGASMGLGYYMATGLAEAGADLVIAARKKERLEEAAHQLSQLGGRVIALSCDVAKPDDLTELMETAQREFGRLDILVNNAGIAWAAAAEDYPLEKWEQVMHTNVTGLFLACQAAGRIMIKQGSGKIINIASITGLVGMHKDVLNAVAYNASKGAVIALTKDLAVKWAPYGINVNCIAPGWFSTHMSRWVVENRGHILKDQIPMGRIGEPDDLKGVIVFLSSDASRYITGEVLVVDGGYSAM